MSKTVVADSTIHPTALLTLPEAAERVGLSQYQFREIAISQRRIAHIRHHARGKIFFRGKDLQDYLDTCRTPAIGERGRRAAQAAVAASGE